MARTARLSVEIDGRGARRGASGISAEMNRLKGEARGMSREFDLLGRAAQTAIGYFGLRELTRFADEATNVRSRLNALSTSTGELNNHLRTVSALAKETRSDLGATSQLYATMTRSGDDLGLSQARIARITETVNKSFAVTGTDSATASQAIRQLNQAFQSGVLRGDEFNTMAEAAPILMDALAKSMGKPRSELRALAEDGKLTVDKLIEAFSDPNITAGIDEQFAKTIPTIGQRLQLLSNAAVEAIGRFDQLTGATQLLGSGIELLANNLDTLIPLAAALGIGFVAKLAFGAVQARLAIITMSAAAAGAQAPLAALGFTARAAGTSILAAFGGPIGVILGGLTIALGSLAAETANAKLRLDEANGTLAQSADALKIAEDRARAAGIQTEYVGAAANIAEKKFGGLPAILGIVATRFGDVGNNAKYAAEQMVRAKIVEANADIADIDKQLKFREAPVYKSKKGSFEYAVGAVTRKIVGGIEDITGQTADNQKALKARKSALQNFQRELELIQLTPSKAFENAAPGLSSAGGKSGGAGRSVRGGGGGGVDQAAQEAKQLAQFAKQTSDQVAQMREQYDGTASDVAQVNQGMRTLEDLIAELTERKPVNFEQMIADAKALKPLLEDSLRKPFDAILRDQERQIELSRLSAAGREQERQQLELQYQIMGALGAETEDQLAAALKRRNISKEEYLALFGNLDVMRQITAEEARRNQVIDQRLGAAQAVFQNIETTIAEIPTKGLKSIDNFFGDLLDQSRRYFAKAITENLFGGAFKDLENEITGKKDLSAAEDQATQASNLMAKSITDTVGKIEELGNRAAGAANKIAGSTVANDNDTANTDAASTLAQDIGILVEARKTKGNDFDVFARTFQKIFETFLGKDSPLAQSIGDFVGKALKGAFTGQFASSIFGDIFGVKQSKTGSAIGGAIGQIAGDALSGVVGGTLKKTFGDLAGGALGSALGPIGGALGGILGGVIGGLFKKTKTGTATIAFNADSGEFGSTVGGNDAGSRRQAGSLGDSITGGLQRIADQLGGRLSGNGSVSIGVRDGNIRVDPTGRGNTKTKKGAIDFGEDEAGAIKFAIQLMIKEGALEGLRAGTQALLRGGKDLEIQLEKALKFEDVFTQLREIDDPVGAAVEKINKEFEGLIKIFKEAGASSEEYAELERLYQIKRTSAIEQANERLLGSMRDYLFQLTAGQNSVLSPQLRYQNSIAALNDLDARRARGENVSFDQYRSTSDSFLAASRDYNGSTVSFFNDMNRITSAVQNWITSEQARASQTLPTIDFSGVTSAVNNQTTAQTAILNTIAAGIANLNTQLTALNDNVAGSYMATGTSDPRYYQNY